MRGVWEVPGPFGGISEISESVGVVSGSVGETSEAVDWASGTRGKTTEAADKA